MATAKSRCTKCKRVMAYDLVAHFGLELPKGLSEGICTGCGSYKVVMTDEALAEKFYQLTAREMKSYRKGLD